jgi:hypothetical protein
MDLVLSPRQKIRLTSLDVKDTMDNPKFISTLDVGRRRAKVCTTQTSHATATDRVNKMQSAYF